MKLLVVNADDFGFTRDVNEGIVEAHRNGILTATTLMANGKEFDHAVQLAQANPRLDIGCHLVLAGGESVSAPGCALPSDVKALLRAMATRRINVYEELRAQVRKIVATGLAVTHLDAHKHTHVLPQVLAAVARISEEFRIPWIRRPFDMPLGYGSPWKTRLAGRAMRVLGRRFQPVLARHGCRSTDHFAGFAITGRISIVGLIHLLENLPEGSTELMCHPGYCTGELRSAPTRLKESRAAELAVLTSPEVRAAVTRNQLRLVNYREIP